MNPVSGDAEDGLRGATQVSGAAVPQLAVQAQGGVVSGQAVQSVGAAVSGLVAEAGHAGPRVPAGESRDEFRNQHPNIWTGDWGGGETHLPSLERCRLPW